jgi:hypothetical protein
MKDFMGKFFNHGFHGWHGFGRGAEGWPHKAQKAQKLTVLDLVPYEFPEPYEAIQFGGLVISDIRAIRG